MIDWGTTRRVRRRAMATTTPYDKGLHRVGDGTWAYLIDQPA